MLFDLTGKRRRLIQVVYAILALLMGGSLVLFGIGSDAPGGILDALGLSDSSSSSSGSAQYEDEIEDAEDRLEADPNDTRALADLALARYRSGTFQLGGDQETGAIEVTSDARAEFAKAQDAWARYLDQEPKRPDAGVATSIAQLSGLLVQDALRTGDARVALREAESAAEAFRVAADQSDRASDFGSLAIYLYVSGDDKAGEKALDQALALTDKDDRKTLERNLGRQVDQAKKINDELEKAAKAGGQSEDPLGGLGPLGGEGQVPPASP